jgi:N-dimethylarginine dimethylaminohydrolase
MTAYRFMACLIACGLLAIAGVAPEPARAESRVLAGECARQDMKAVAWIDQQLQQRSMPPVLLAEAALRVLQARNTCLHGRVAVALQAYAAALRSAANLSD